MRGSTVDDSKNELSNRQQLQTASTYTHRISFTFLVNFHMFDDPLVGPVR